MTDLIERFDSWWKGMQAVGVSEDTHYHPLLQLALEMRTALREQEEEANKRIDKWMELITMKDKRIEELEAALRTIAYMDLNSIHSDPCNIAGRALDHAEDKTDE